MTSTIYAQVGQYVCLRAVSAGSSGTMAFQMDVTDETKISSLDDYLAVFKITESGAEQIKPHYGRVNGYGQDKKPPT